MSNRIRVIVGEDSFLVREGIVSSLQRQANLDVVAAEADLDALRSAIDRLEPDCVVTDIRMPPTETDEGIRLAEELRATHPEVAVVVLSQVANVGYATALFEHQGARRAYLLKDRILDPDYLAGVIESVVQGRPMLDQTIFSLVISEQTRPRTGLDGLTPRELDVLELVAGGLTNGSIAKRLTITHRGVERHINTIFTKLDLADADTLNRRVVAALLYARAHGDTLASA